MTDLVDDNSNNPAPAGTVSPVVPPSIDAPISMSPVTAGSISTPNALSRVSSGSIGTPNDIGAITGGSISTPNNLSRVSAGSISTPNALNRVAAGSVSAPNTLSPVAKEHLPRTIKPVLGLNFNANSYTKGGQGRTLTDALTILRPSTASYVGSVKDSLGQEITRILSVGTNTARIEKNGLLVEGVSTNRHTNSEDFSQPNWFANEAETIVNQGIAPDGELTADKLQANSSGSSQPSIADSFTGLLAGETFTLSLYIKPLQVIYFQIRFAVGNITGTPRANFNLATGELGTVDSEIDATITHFDDGWYRISVTATSQGTTITPAYQLIDSPTAGLGSSGTFSDGDGLLLWGGQVEQLPFATSYIKTLGSPVSRSADSITADVIESDTEATLIVEGSTLGIKETGTQTMLNYYESGTGNRVSIVTTSNANNARFFVQTDRFGGVDLTELDSDMTTEKTLALTVAQNDADVFINGIRELGDGSVIVGNLDKVAIGSLTGASEPFYGNIRRAEVYNKKLTNDEVKYL